MKVTAILKGVPDGQGKQKVYIRIADGTKRIFKATKIKVQAKDFAAGKVKYPHPDAATYNTIIKKLITETESAYLSGNYTPKRDLEFFAFAKSCINQWQHTKKQSTITRFQSDLNNLRGFRHSFRLSDVTPQFLNQLVTHLYNQGLSQNSVWATMKNIHVFIRAAIQDELITSDPFTKYNAPKYTAPRKIYLTRKEVERIESYTGRYLESATWFLIGCFTGLRYSDMQAFSRDCIVNGRLVVSTIKTGSVVAMPVSERLKILLDRIDYQPLSISNDLYNIQLTKIAADTGITKKITAHTSRHTFATMCAESGISIEVTAKLLGHSNIRQTEVYYKITNPRIDSELKKLG